MAFEYNNLIYNMDVGDYVKIKLGPLVPNKLRPLVPNNLGPYVTDEYFVGQFCGLELHENKYDTSGHLIGLNDKSGIKKLTAVIRLIWPITHIGGNDKVYLTTFPPSDFIKLSDEEAMIYIFESE